MLCGFLFKYFFVVQLMSKMFSTLRNPPSLWATPNVEPCRTGCRSLIHSILFVFLKILYFLYIFLLSVTFILYFTNMTDQYNTSEGWKCSEAFWTYGNRLQTKAKRRGTVHSWNEEMNRFMSLVKEDTGLLIPWPNEEKNKLYTYSKLLGCSTILNDATQKCLNLFQLHNTPRRAFISWKGH